MSSYELESNSDEKIQIFTKSGKSILQFTCLSSRWQRLVQRNNSDKAFLCLMTKFSVLIFSNESTNQLQQFIADLLFVVQIPLNMFRAFLFPSSGAYQLQQQPLVYRRSVVVAVLLVVVGLAGPTTTNNTATTYIHIPDAVHTGI